MSRLIKFSLKVGTLGGTIYYFRKVGVWDNSTKTYELSKEIVTYISPYVNRLQKETPVEVKNLPSSEDVCRTVSTYWNKGVVSSVTFIGDVPNTVNSYFTQGLNYSVNYLTQTTIPPKSESS